MSQPMNCYVEIVETETTKVIKRMGPMDERKAERVERGVLINLNHERFYTRIQVDHKVPI